MCGKAGAQYWGKFPIENFSVAIFQYWVKFPLPFWLKLFWLDYWDIEVSTGLIMKFCY